MHDAEGTTHTQMENQCAFLKAKQQIFSAPRDSIQGLPAYPIWYLDRPTEVWVADDEVR